MDQKLLSPSELLKTVEKMILESPVLSKEDFLRKQLLSAAKQLDQGDLQNLLELLQAEETDWNAYFDDLKARKTEILTYASNESLHLQKEAEKTVLKAEESITEEEDTSRAEQLLKQL
jgi:hypothetical protein